MSEVGDEKADTDVFRPVSYRCAGVRGGTGQIMQGYANKDEGGMYKRVWSELYLESYSIFIFEILIC